MPMAAASLKATGKWLTKSSSGSYFNKFRVAAKAGAYLSTPVSAKHTILIVTKCSTCGYVDVFLGSARLAHINLKAGGTKKKQIVVIGNYPTAKTGLLKIKAPKTGPLVQIEGLGVSPG